MNIDLLRTKDGRFGHVCDRLFPAAPCAVLLDAKQGVLSVEFAESQDEALVCNIPIVEEWRHRLTFEESILMGCITDGIVIGAERLPLKVLS